jgi:hypothetical protein
VREAGKEEVRQLDPGSGKGAERVLVPENRGCEILPDQWVRDSRDVGSYLGSGSEAWEDKAGADPGGGGGGEMGDLSPPSVLLVTKNILFTFF